MRARLHTYLIAKWSSSMKYIFPPALSSTTALGLPMDADLASAPSPVVPVLPYVPANLVTIPRRAGTGGVVGAWVGVTEGARVGATEGDTLGPVGAEDGAPVATTTPTTWRMRLW